MLNPDTEGSKNGLYHPRVMDAEAEIQEGNAMPQSRLSGLSGSQAIPGDQESDLSPGPQSTHL